MTGSGRSDSLPAYSTTSVPVGRSQEEIRAVLRRHGAESFQFGEGLRGGVRMAGVSFRYEGRDVTMLVPIKVPTRAEVDRIEVKAKKRRGWLVPEEWAEMRIWRVIAWTLRARMIAVEEGVETFEQAFLAHLIYAGTGRTIYEELAAEGQINLGHVLPQLGTGDDA